MKHLNLKDKRVKKLKASLAKETTRYSVKILAKALIIIALLSSCNKTTLVGSWVQEVPGQKGNTQGIKIEKNGKAASINMHTLLYNSWEQKGERLILSGKSIGNKQTFAFTDTLVIEKLSSDSLVLKRGTFRTSYSRKAAP